MSWLTVLSLEVQGFLNIWRHNLSKLNFVHANKAQKAKSEILNSNDPLGYSHNPTTQLTLTRLWKVIIDITLLHFYSELQQIFLWE